MTKIPAAIFVLVLGVAAIVAMSASGEYFPNASLYINLGVLILTLAAVVGYFVRKKVGLKPRG